MNMIKRIQKTVNLTEDAWFKIDKIREKTGISTTAIISLIINNYVNEDMKIM